MARLRFARRAIFRMLKERRLTSKGGNPMKVQTLLLKSVGLAFASMALALPAAYTMPFRDVYAGHWAEMPIEVLSNQGILGGYPDGTFHPEFPITRAEVAAVFTRAFGLQPVYTNHVAFRDVSPKHWAYASISAAERAGLIQGYPGRWYMPVRNVTRAELMAMLANAAHLPLPSAAEQTQILSQFRDAYLVPGWARPAVAAVIAHELFASYPDPSLIRPKNTASRGDVAVMVAAARARRTGTVVTPPPPVAPAEATGVPAAEVSPPPTTTEATTPVVVTGPQTVPAPTRFTVTTPVVISSEFGRPDDPLRLSLDQPLMDEKGLIAVPSGSYLVGHIEAVDPAGYGTRPAKIKMVFDSLQLPDGREVPVDVEVATSDGWLTAREKGALILSPGDHVEVQLIKPLSLQ